MRVCVVGLGKVGLPLAVMYASRGLDVVGCDLNPAIVDAVNRGECLIPNEPEIPELLTAAVNTGRLEATINTARAASTADVSVIIVPLIVDARREIDFRSLDAAVEAVGRGLRHGSLVLIET